MSSNSKQYNSDNNNKMKVTQSHHLLMWENVLSAVWIYHQNAQMHRHRFSSLHSCSGEDVIRVVSVRASAPQSPPHRFFPMSGGGSEVSDTT